MGQLLLCSLPLFFVLQFNTKSQKGVSALQVVPYIYPIIFVSSISHLCLLFWIMLINSPHLRGKIRFIAFTSYSLLFVTGGAARPIVSAEEQIIS